MPKSAFDENGCTYNGSLAGKKLACLLTPVGHPYSHAA